jgi:hypothetical protein
VICFTAQLLAVVASLSALAVGQVVTVYVDFGNTQLPTTSPDGFGHYWNNATQEPGTGLPNLMADDGWQTGISLSYSGYLAFNPYGSVPTGTESPDATALGGLAIPQVTRDWLVVTGSQVANLTIGNLPSDGVYRLSLFASHNSDQRRVTQYTVAGLATSTKLLQTSGTGIGIDPQPNANRKSLAIFESLLPTADGRLTISVARHEGDAGYLGALRLELMNEANFPPSATMVRTAGSFRVGSPMVGRYVYNDRENDPEAGSTRFWERATTLSSTPVRVSESSSEGLSFIPTNAELGTYLRFGVIPKASSGRATGSVAYSNWVGPIVSRQTFTSFHIGSSYTQWANMPQQLKNLSASRSVPIVTGWQVTSGRDSRYHWENGLDGVIGAGTYSRHELQTGSWDVVVLQPYNTEWQSWQINQILDYGKRFYELADSHGSQFYLYAAWPSRSQGLGLQDSINQAFQTIRSSISDGGGKPALIIPAGEAFRAVILEAANGYLKPFNTTGSLNRENWYIDDLHQTDLGAYVSALTHYATLMKRSPVGLPAQALDANFYHDNPVSFDPALATRIQEIVWWVVANYPNSGVVEQVPKPVDPANLPLLAFAFGVSSDGVSPIAENLPHVVTPVTPGKIEVEYVMNPDAESQGVNFTPEWSHDLVQWTLVQPAFTAITRTNQTVRVSWPESSGSRFMRLRVSR